MKFIVQTAHYAILSLCDAHGSLRASYHFVMHTNRYTILSLCDALGSLRASHSRAPTIIRNPPYRATYS